MPGAIGWLSLFIPIRSLPVLQPPLAVVQIPEHSMDSIFPAEKACRCAPADPLQVSRDDRDLIHVMSGAVRRRAVLQDARGAGHGS